MIDCCRRLILTCFANNSVFGSHVLDISCYNNYLYCSYNSVNMEDNSDVSDWELYNIIMRYFLYYLETNKWHRYQKCITIAKEMDICTTKFKLKESEKIYGYSNAGQVSTAVKKAAIVNQRMEDCKKV